MPVFKSNSWGWNGKKENLVTREDYKRIDGAPWYKPALMQEIEKAFAAYPADAQMAMRETAHKKLRSNNLSPKSRNNWMRNCKLSSKTGCWVNPGIMAMWIWMNQ